MLQGKMLSFLLILKVAWRSIFPIISVTTGHYHPDFFLYPASGRLTIKLRKLKPRDSEMREACEQT